MLRRIATLVMTVAVITPGAWAGEFEVDVRKHVLDNGMTILVAERHGAPVFSSYVIYKVGSANEWAGMIGAAHLLEHMLFKGTHTIGTKDYTAEKPLLDRQDEIRSELRRLRHSRRSLDFQRQQGLPDVPDPSEQILKLEAELAVVEERLAQLVEKSEYEELYVTNGASQFNAGTGYDATTYYISLPSNRLEFFMTVEAERMSNPVLREFYAERDVVIEERRLRVDNEPNGLLWTMLVGAAFIAHPYQIAWEWKSEVAMLTRPKLEEFYRRYYAPNRMVLAIVGDVDADEVFRLADKHFSATPSQPEPEPINTVEPVQQGERRIVQKFDAEPQLMIGYHKTAFDHSDELVFRVMHRLLAGGRTSRLYKALVLDQQIALDVSTWEYPGAETGDLYPNIFVIESAPKAPHTNADLEAAIYTELEKLTAEPVAARELEKIKNQIEADYIWGFYSNLGLASQIAEYEARAGDWRYMVRIGDRIRDISADDVKRVAADYFNADNRTVATLERTTTTANLEGEAPSE